MSARRRQPWVQSLATLGIAALLGWGCFIGAGEIVQGLHTGLLDNRTGPDVSATAQPVVFRALAAFHTAATLAGAGLALLLSAIAVRDLIAGHEGSS